MVYTSFKLFIDFTLFGIELAAGLGGVLLLVVNHVHSVLCLLTPTCIVAVALSSFFSSSRGY